MTKIVAVTAVAPALGCTTVSQGLRDWLVARDVSVDLFEEDEVLTRPEFAPMARELAVTGHVSVETLSACVSTFAETAAASDVDLVLCDSLFPFVRSLSDWGNGEHAIDGFLATTTTALASIPLTVVYLDADIHAALQHAAVREPAGWLDYYVAQLIRNEQASTTTHLEMAVAILGAEREVALRLMAEHDWDVARVVDCDLLTADEILDRAQRQLEPSLA